MHMCNIHAYACICTFGTLLTNEYNKIVTDDEMSPAIGLRQMVGNCMKTTGLDTVFPENCGETFFVR